MKFFPGDVFLSVVLLQSHNLDDLSGHPPCERYQHWTTNGAGSVGKYDGFSAVMTLSSPFFSLSVYET